MLKGFVSKVCPIDCILLNPCILYILNAYKLCLPHTVHTNFSLLQVFGPSKQDQVLQKMEKELVYVISCTVSILLYMHTQLLSIASLCLSVGRPSKANTEECPAAEQVHTAVVYGLPLSRVCSHSKLGEIQDEQLRQHRASLDRDK